MVLRQNILRFLEGAPRTVISYNSISSFYFICGCIFVFICPAIGTSLIDLMPGSIRGTIQRHAFACFAVALATVLLTFLCMDVYHFMLRQRQ